eukprot:gene8036-5785_t
MTETGMIWLLQLPDDVLRVLFSDFLRLWDFVQLDTALCHHRSRRALLTLLPSLKVVFPHDRLLVDSWKTTARSFAEQMRGDAPPHSATFAQFQFAQRRGLVVPEIYIKARISSTDLFMWAPLLQAVKMLKLEPNESERMRSKTLLRYLRSLSPHLRGIQSFELIPFWSLYRYDDDASSDAGGAEELGSEMSADFTEDTASSVDGSFADEERPMPMVSKTLLNILTHYYPQLRSIEVRSVDGLEAIHLTNPAMATVWSRLRVLHLHSVTFYFHSYNALFATLVSESQSLESLHISLPPGDVSRATIDPSVFLRPLETLVPASLENSLRRLTALSGDFMLVYPVYFYLCGGSQCLRSLELCYRSKSIEEHMMRVAARDASHLFGGHSLPQQLEAVSFHASPALFLPAARSLVVDWLWATLLLPFAGSVRELSVSGLDTTRQSLRSLPSSVSTNTSSRWSPLRLHSLQYECDGSGILPHWFELSEQLAASRGEPVRLQRLALAPGCHLPHPVTAMDDRLLRSLQPWRCTLCELSVAVLPSDIDLSAFFAAFAPSGEEAAGGVHWSFSSLQFMQLKGRATSNVQLAEWFHALLPRLPALRVLDVSRVDTQTRSSAPFLSLDVADQLVRWTSKLHSLHLPAISEVAIGHVLPAIAAVVGRLHQLRWLSFFSVTDERRLTMTPPPLTASLNAALEDLWCELNGPEGTRIDRRLRYRRRMVEQLSVLPQEASHSFFGPQTDHIPPSIVFDCTTCT